MQSFSNPLPRDAEKKKMHRDGFGGRKERGEDPEREIASQRLHDRLGI